MIQLNPACHKLLADIHAMESGPIPAHHNIEVNGDDFEIFKHLMLAGYAVGAFASNEDDMASYIEVRTTDAGRAYLSTHA